MIRLAILTMALGACGTARSTAAYRADTLKVLETRTGQLDACYDTALKEDPSAKGLLTVHFEIEKKTGVITHVSIDPTKAVAQESLLTCVTNAFANLKLDPPDRNRGEATFVYELRPAPT